MEKLINLQHKTYLCPVCNGTQTPAGVADLRVIKMRCISVTKSVALTNHWKIKGLTFP